MAAEYESSATDWAGTTLEVSDGASPPTWTAVAEIKTIGFGEMSTDRIDITHFLSPNAHKESLPGLRDTGELSFGGNWLPNNITQSNDQTGAGGLVYLQRKRIVKDWRIVLGNSGSPATAWQIRGYLSKFKPGDAAMGAGKTFTGAIQPSKDTAADLP